MLNKNLSLLLFVALVAAGCAPKTERKPIPPGNTQEKQIAGDQAGNGKPEAREAPAPQPSTAPSSAPPSPTPSSTPPSPTPQTQPNHQDNPPTQQQPQQPQQQAPAKAPAQTPAQTPNQALAQIGAPTQSAPEQETKPGLQKILWMRLHGDGQSALEPEMSVVASPPIKESRGGESSETGRTLVASFEINNLHGKVTRGSFEFRHPQNGAIEKFNVADATKDTSTEDLKNATEANKRTPMPFEIQIRVPIDDVTQDMLFTIADGFRDFAKRDAKINQETEAAKNSNPVKAGASDNDKILAELKRLEARVNVIDGTDEEKRLDSKIRLGINKDRLAELILKPAFEKWKAMFYDDECVEKDPDDLSKSTPPNCHGDFWLFNRRRDDIKEFNRYLDDKANVERIVQEYLKATEAVKAEAKRQALAAQQALQAGQTAPLAPPPPADLASGDVRILKTNGQDSGTKLTQPNRIKLVFVGDAFTADQSETFYQEAQKKWDYLFGSANEKGVEPFRTYRNYFMGVAISTVSNQGKACHPSAGDDCRSGHGRTALEVQFGVYGIERLLGMTRDGYKHIASLLKAKVADYDLAAVIVNDTEYGGAGGSYALVSLDPNANEVIAHELMGHSFAKLGDEYTDPYPSFPNMEEPNTETDSTKAEGKKWAQHMLQNKSDLATQAPDESQLIQDAVQGAHYHQDGWWRPFRSCKMRMLGQPFCSVCRDTIIKAIYNKIKPIDSVTTTPAMNDKDALVAKASVSWQIKITTLQPEQPTMANASTSLLKIQWLVGEKDCAHAQPIDGATSDTLTAETAKLKPGSYKVCAKVTDTNLDVARLKLDLGQANPLEQIRAFDLRIK